MTTDGGKNWEPQYGDHSTNDFFDVCFTDSLNGWVFGGNGVIGLVLLIV